MLMQDLLQKKNRSVTGLVCTTLSRVIAALDPAIALPTLPSSSNLPRDAPLAVTLARVPMVLIPSTTTWTTRLISATRSSLLANSESWLLSLIRSLPF